MSAPAFGTIGAQDQNSTGSISMAVPASVASGDIIVAFLFISGTATVTAMPSGFAHAENSPVTNPGGGGGAGSHSLSIMWKRATGADTGTYDFTLSATTYRNGAAARYTGAVAAGNPWDTAGTGAAATNTTGSTVTPAVSLTTAGPDRLLVFSGCNWFGGAWTPPTGFAERLDTGDEVLTVDDVGQAAAGGTGNVTATCAGSDKESAWLGALIGTTVTGSVPWNPQRTLAPQDCSRSWWAQRDRRDANTVATAANALPSPLDSAWQAGGGYWHLYADSALRDRRMVPQQRPYASIPQPYRVNTAEGAPSSGTTVTTGNSGGASGDPWSAITIGTTGALTFDSSQTAHGGYAYSLSTGGTSAVVTASWTGMGSNPTLWWRCYLRLSAANAGQALVRFRAGGAQVHRVTVTAAGKLVIRDSANTIVATSTTTLAANTWYRVEGYCTVGAAGTAELKIWTSIDDGGTAAETLTAASQNYGTVNIDEAMWGIVGTTANVNQYWLDDLAVSDAGYLGPSGTSSDPLLGGADDLRRHLGYGPSYQPQWTPRQRSYVSDPLLLPPFLLENELLGSVSDLLRHRHAAVYADRRQVPQQRAYISNPAAYGPAELENELLGSVDDLVRHRGAAAYVDRRLVPQQRAYVSDPLLLGPALLENELLGSVDDLRRRAIESVYLDRRLVPQQRLYVSDPGLLGTAELEDELLGWADTGRRYAVPATHSPRWWVPQQPKRDGYTPGLLDGAQLENELLGSVDDLGRHRHAAVYVDRRQVPQQRLYLSVAGLLDAALLENELLGGSGTAQRNLTPASHTPRWWAPQQPARRTLYFDAGPDVPPLTLAWGAGGMYDLLYQTAGWQPDRREVPQQRAYISDPSTYPTVAPIDPLTVAWGVGGPYWWLYNTAAGQVDRRAVPQQRRYLSDPALLPTALLEGGLLGSADDLRRRAFTAAYGDRRLVPPQRAYTDVALLGPAQVENELLGGADDLRRRYGVAAGFVDRRLAPAQRVYYDTSLLASALLENELLGNAGTWARYAEAATHADRRVYPTQRLYRSDPLLLATAQLENELLGGADGWRRYVTAASHGDRRQYPTQRLYVSDPGLLLSALLEGALLGGSDDRARHAALFFAASPVRQPARFGANDLTPPVAADPLLLAGGVGGDTWRRYTTAVLVDRWLPWPWQPPRRALWFTTPRDLLFSFGPARSSWVTRLSPQARWMLGEPSAKWTIRGPLVLTYSVLSTELVRVTASATSGGTKVDPTADVVQFAFVAAGTSPTSGDWHNGSWDNNPANGVYLAECLIGPGGTVALPVGVYAVWVKVVDSPEVPVRQVDSIQII